MTLRGIPQGGVPIGMQNAVNGTVTVMNLTSLATGNAQNAANSLLPSDFVIVTVADGTNKGLTIPDPNKYGGAVGDAWLVTNGQSGQTINVYPPTGGNIDGAGNNTAATCAAGATLTLLLVSWTATTSVWIGDGGS